MKAKLLVVGSNVKASEITLRLPTVIGRGKEATLALPHPLVSRRHCELFEIDGVLMVRDLGSLNGTFVGNKRVVEAPIPSGELLTVANVNFRVIFSDSPDTDDSEQQYVSGEDSTKGPQTANKSPAQSRQTESSDPIPSSNGDGPIDRDTKFQGDY